MTVVVGLNDIWRRKTFSLRSMGRDRWLALTLVVASGAMFFALLPFVNVQLEPKAPFIPAYLSALLICCFLTSVLLYGQFSAQHRRGLLVLASAYLFVAVTIAPNPSAFGMFLPKGLFGSGPQASSWLTVLREGGFPLFVIAYALVKQDHRLFARARDPFLVAVGVTVAVVIGVAMLATTDGMPTLMRPDNSKTPLMDAIMYGIWGLDFAALLLLILRRPHASLDLWLIVVMVAWTCQVGLGTVLNTARYDLGYYTGRVYGVLAASFVLVMLLLETRSLYRRLARSLAQERTAAEGRADAAQRVSQETAETLRAVVDASSLAVLALSPEGNVLLWNKTAERLFGYSSDEVIGQGYPLLPHEAEARAEQRSLFDRALAGATLKDLRFQCRCKDGTEPDILGSAAPFRDAAGALRGVAFALQDITEKNATEEMLRQSQKMEAVGQLTGGVAHDFNNILMVILANVEELLEDDRLADEHREMLTNVSTSGQRAAELTKRLLAFSRKQRLMPQPTNLTDLVGGVDKLLRRTLGEQIEIEAILADDPWVANVDRSQVEAALVNLCVNARDAMPSGGRLLIEISNCELDQDYASANPDVVPGEYVMLAVSDTGSGMAPEILKKVFEPFFTTKGIGKGTGLGLSMVYGFIKQSSGHIKIYSEVGRGTTIRMYMPRSDAPAEDSTAGARAILPRGTERLLLVEDDDQVRAAVLTQLRSLGYDVTEAGSGEAALECLAGAPAFDLMLTDVIMPGMGGPELARAAAESRPGLKVIFMSGYSENAAKNHGRLDPGAHILSKPFRKIDLAKRIRQIIDDRD